MAAGGAELPIRPLQVEGTYTPPAYLLADARGRLHTGGTRNSNDLRLGLAVADVRDVIGHEQIVVAGATWPASSVVRARLFNPLREIDSYLGGTDLVALPYPHDWSDEKIDAYGDLVAGLGVEVEPLPESVALAGYVRATEFPPSNSGEAVRHGVTAVYCDGRTALVVAVQADRDRPTESVDVPVPAAAVKDARAADQFVYDVLAGARSVQAETTTVVLTGSVCFNDSIRLAFQNNLGHRLRIADHPMHAIALGAVDLLAGEDLGQSVAPPVETTVPVAAPTPARTAPMPQPPVPAPAPAPEPTPQPPAPVPAPPQAREPIQPPLISPELASVAPQPPPAAQSVPTPLIGTPEPAALLRRRGLSGVVARHPWPIAVAIAVVALLLVIGGMVWARPDVLSVQQARVRVSTVMPMSAELDGLPVVHAPADEPGTVERDNVTVTTGVDIVSMACASVPMTAPESKGAKASATERFVLGNKLVDSRKAGEPQPGDGIALRATYYDPGTVDDVFSAVSERIQNCPNRPSDTLRYIVAVPSSGPDPGPPLQVGAPRPEGDSRLDTANGNRLAWRGLVPKSQSPIGIGEQMTCLMDRTADLVVRSCGMSLDSRRADALASSGLAALSGR